MKCPACHKVLAVHFLDDVELDVCQEGCGGIWFDAFELSSVSERIRADVPSAAVEPNLPVVPDRKRACPRCLEVKLQRHFYSNRRQVEVDSCPGCGGIWLDVGELSAVREQRADAGAQHLKHDYRCISISAVREQHEDWKRAEKMRLIPNPWGVTLRQRLTRAQYVWHMAWEIAKRALTII